MSDHEGRRQPVRPSECSVSDDTGTGSLPELLQELDPRHRSLIDALRTQQVTLRARNAELCRLHEALAASHHRYRQLLELGPVGYFALNHDGVVREVNGSAARLLKQRPELLRDQNVQILIAGEDRHQVDRCLAQALHEGSAACEAGLLDSRGERIPVQMTMACCNEAGETLVLVCVMDVRVHLEAQAQLRNARDSMRHLAYHDVLTQLPNRLLFTDRLEQAVLRARRRRGKVALLFLDVDRFKFINDSLGHHAGDTLLCELARRIRGCVRRDDTVARIAGDEFTVVLENVERAEQVQEVATKILGTLREPMALEGHQIFITASIGCALHPDHGSTPDELLRHADSAMFSSKDHGRDRVTVFDPEAPTGGGDVLRVATELRRALAGGELELHYQPQIRGDSGRIAGYEALIRWHHPSRGLLLPDDFLPAVDEAGLTHRLGERVLGLACEQLASWQRTAPDLRVAVNVAAGQLCDAGFVGLVHSSLEGAGAHAPGLELEITEGALGGDPRLAIENLHRLRELGIQIAIDDFGKGFSALGRLRSLPISRLKIDAAFVRGIPEDRDDRALASAIISMGHGLGLEVVAEGVETDAQRRFLEAEGSDFLQGFHLGKPAPAGSHQVP